MDREMCGQTENMGKWGLSEENVNNLSLELDKNCISGNYVLPTKPTKHFTKTKKIRDNILIYMVEIIHSRVKLVMRDTPFLTYERRSCKWLNRLNMYIHYNYKKMSERSVCAALRHCCETKCPLFFGFDFFFLLCHILFSQKGLSLQG
jgi:hypothetical protein